MTVGTGWAPVVMGDNLLSDNPELYEAVFPDPGHLGGRFVDGVVRRFGGGRLLVDLGCGTGRDAGFLAGAGYEVTGVDCSAAMLAYARARHPDVAFAAGRFETLALGRRFEVATCLDSALLSCHTNAALAGALAAFRTHLLDGGLLVVELRNGAFLLGDDELVAEDRSGSVVLGGTEVRWRSRLRVDHARQLLRRSRRWEWDGAEALEQSSAWRLLFPLELAYFLEVAGFEVLASFDRPGPRTPEVWSDACALQTALTGDRLHVVARAVAPPKDTKEQP